MPDQPLVRNPAVTIDVSDLTRSAAFWGALLGVEPGEVRSNGQYLTVGHIHGEMILTLQRVPEKKTVKNRVHLDFTVDDVDRAIERIAAMGGSFVSGPRPGGGVTMADPDGNEFCIGAFTRDLSGKRVPG